ncbi:MAG: hypothetical protein R3195_19640 [Gemmatimonadota bacterium]|nr:hypothetical protein [Gemmatimonadota bacterium]
MKKLNRTATACLAALTISILVAAPATAQIDDADVAGLWEGQYATGQDGGDARLSFERVDDAWQLTVTTTSSAYPNSDPQRATDVVIDGSRIEFTIHWGPRPIRFTGEVTAEGMSGELAADHFGGTWEVARTDSELRT